MKLARCRSAKIEFHIYRIHIPRCRHRHRRNPRGRVADIFGPESSGKTTNLPPLIRPKRRETRDRPGRVSSTPNTPLANRYRQKTRRRRKQPDSSPRSRIRRSRRRESWRLFSYAAERSTWSSSIGRGSPTPQRVIAGEMGAPRWRPGAADVTGPAEAHGGESVNRKRPSSYEPAPPYKSASIFVNPENHDSRQCPDSFLRLAPGSMSGASKAIKRRP